METLAELKAQQIETLCFILRKSFDEACTRYEARRVIEAAELAKAPSDFIDDMKDDFRAEFKFGLVISRTLKVRWDDRFTFEENEDGGWYCWMDALAPNLEKIAKRVGWCYVAPKELFIDNDSIDTAAADHDHSATKFHDPRTMVGASQRVYHGRGLLKIVTF